MSKFDRRKFLFTMGKAGALVAASSMTEGVLGQIGIDIYGGLYEGAKKVAGFGNVELELTDFQKRTGRRILLGNGLHTRIIPATFNPISGDGSTEGVTSPAKVACDAIVKLFEINSNHISTVDSSRVAGFAGNICSVGGPIANGFTELFFGQNGKSSIFEIGSNPFEMPMYIDNETALNERDSGAAYLDIEGKRQPVWRVALRGIQVVPSYSPDRLLEDFLLITRLPNFLHRNSLELGMTLTFIAGANGSGTRSVKLILKADQVLRDLDRLCPAIGVSNIGWQALIHIPRLDENVEPVSIGEIIKFETFELDINSLFAQANQYMTKMP